MSKKNHSPVLRLKAHISWSQFASRPIKNDMNLTTALILNRARLEPLSTQPKKTLFIKAPTCTWLHPVCLSLLRSHCPKNFPVLQEVKRIKLQAGHRRAVLCQQELNHIKSTLIWFILRFMSLLLECASTNCSTRCAKCTRVGQRAP